MKLVKIKHKPPVGTMVYHIYTKEEADQLGIEYKDWRIADVGEYGITDDNYVGVCIRKWENKYRGGKVRFTAKTFPMGTGVVLSNGKTKRLEYLTRKTNDIYYFGSSTKPRKSHCLSNKEAKVYAKAYVLTMDPTWAYKFIRPWTSDKMAQHWGNVFLNSKQGRIAVRKEVNELLEDMGYTDENVMQLLQEALDLARAKKDCTNFNRTLEHIMRLKGFDRPRLDDKNRAELMGKMEKFLQQVSAMEVPAEVVETQKENDNANL